jgi:hypothetical protein
LCTACLSAKNQWLSTKLECVLPARVKDPDNATSRLL